MLIQPTLGAVYNDVYEVPVNGSRLMRPLENDPGDVRLTAFSHPKRGFIVPNWRERTLLYTPDAEFVGFDYCIYTSWEPSSDTFRAAYIMISVRQLTGDLNYDGFVGQDDLNTVLSQWGQRE